LVTLDNITEVEMKNRELSQVVNKLQMTTDDVQTKNKELEFLATHDPLTLLLNRRALNQRFEKAFVDAQMTEGELSCVMCDIDHFKAVNDRYGHATGDKVIKMVAGLLQKNFRENDLVGRYGGEEFCIILPNIDLKMASEISNRIRQAIKEDTSSGVQVTISFGVSALTPDVHTSSELANQADKALYIAKESGRNRVVCWGDDEVEGFASSDATEPASLPTLAKSGEHDRLSEDTGHQEQTENTDEVKRLNLRLRELQELAEKRSQELEHYTAYDVQTGLPTRTLFHDRVSQALMRGRRYENIVAVLSISVDAVQRISETLGHESGEWLFKEIGKRLTKVIRSMDTVAKLPSASLKPTVSRLGQEEFGVLLTDIEEVNAITWIVKRILNSLEKAFDLEGSEIYTTTNIGISIYPHDGESPEELERNAAAAKSHSKKHLGTNQYYFYSDAIHAASIKHLQVENQLRRAIRNNEFLLHYQPKIKTATGEIVGAEALIRWDNPGSGLVAPYEFIPIAEYSGLITQIGDWVLSTACRQVRAWLDMGITHCTVAVNFSNKQFRQANLSSRISNLLKENRLNPEHLVVEVTENSMMENIDSSLKILHEIREMGINIALDDFGTGYSSLGYLKNFPVSHVKIDRSFIADIETNNRDATLVKSIINMAHGMDLKVTAEGVENETQVSMLYDFGCDEMQGFLFSKPVPQQEATALFQTGIKHKMELWKEYEAA
jgi:diguanylate cyclase (GGDEF)-like protein